MPRRVSLPGASELFRTTQEPSETGPAPAAVEQTDERSANVRTLEHIVEPSVRGSGRIRHDEKITVYVSSAELLALEQARLTLRARHGMAVDRGRIVREAISAVIADLEANGESSELVRRLAGS